MRKLLILVLAMGITSSAWTASPQFRPLFGEKLEKADYAPEAWRLDDSGILRAYADTPIWTKGRYRNFHVSFEFQLEVRSNSGFFFRSDDRNTSNHRHLEIQLVDSHTDRKPYQHVGSFYGYQGADQPETIPGGWNKMEVLSQGDKIQVFLNDRKINELQPSQWNDRWKGPAGTPILEIHHKHEPLAECPPEGYLGFQGYHRGATGLAPVYYRNILILEGETCHE